MRDWVELAVQLAKRNRLRAQRVDLDVVLTATGVKRLSGLFSFLQASVEEV